MIIQAYQTFQEFNQTGLDGIMQYTAEVVPVFPALMLFSFFIIALLGSYFASKRLTGIGNFLASFAVAAYLSTIVSFVMALIPNFLNPEIVVITLVVSVIATMLLLFKN